MFEAHILHSREYLIAGSVSCTHAFVSNSSGNGSRVPHIQFSRALKTYSKACCTASSLGSGINDDDKNDLLVIHYLIQL